MKKICLVSLACFSAASAFAQTKNGIEHMTSLMMIIFLALPIMPSFLFVKAMFERKKYGIQKLHIASLLLLAAMYASYTASGEMLVSGWNVLGVAAFIILSLSYVFKYVLDLFTRVYMMIMLFIVLAGSSIGWFISYGYVSGDWTLLCISAILVIGSGLAGWLYASQKTSKK